MSLYFFNLVLVHATFQGGDGSVGNPYEIGTCSNLQDISLDLYASYVLVSHINCSETINWNLGEGFDPIYNFRGVLDGNNYIVSDLFINRPNQNEIGVFQRVLNEAEIFDIRFDGANVTGHYKVGVLAGMIKGPTISNVQVYNSVSSGFRQVGLLVGIVSASKYNYADISLISTSGKVIASDHEAGGVIGFSKYANLNKLSSNVIVNGDKNYVGGILGNMYKTNLDEAYFSGEINGDLFVGGIVGRIAESNLYFVESVGDVLGLNQVGGIVGYSQLSLIENSYFISEIDGTSLVGGIAGIIDRTIVNNTFSVPTFLQHSSSTGGLIGHVTPNFGPSTIVSSYWDLDVSQEEDSAGGEGKSTGQMYLQSTYVNWDFSSIWDINEYESYPYLR